MPADATLLEKLRQPEQVNWDKYKVPGDFTPPPQPKDADGKPLQFKATAPPAFEFSATQEGFLMAKIDPITILEGSAKGYQIRFTNASAKKFTNRKTNEQIEASMLGNYLRSVDKNLRPQTNADYIKAVESTARRAFSFTADWDAYDSEAQKSVAEKYEDFPVDPANPGKRLPYITLPDGRRLWARLRIKQFIPVK